MTTYSQISKELGWGEPPCAYPALMDVGQAVATKNLRALFRWNRFCPSPVNDEQVEILNAVSEGFELVQKEFR